MINQDPTPVSLALAEKNIPHRLFQHPGPIRSLEQAAQERGQEPEQIVRSIVFRLSADEFIMVLVAGPRQIDWRILRQIVGQPRLTMANKDEVVLVTGYELGAVAPFGLPAPMRVLVDESIMAQSEISVGSGVRGTTVIMKRRDLMKALGDVELVRVAKG